MLNLQKESQDELPLGKILGITVFILLIGIGGLKWYGDYQNEQEADKWYIKAKDYCRSNDSAGCITAIDKALSRKEKPEYLKVKFNVLYSQSKLYESKALLEKLIALDPKNAHLYYLMSNLQYNDDDLKAATQSIEKAVQLEPRDVTYRISQAALYSHASDIDKARKVYEQLLQEDPNNFNAWDQYANAYANNNMENEALALRLKGVAQFPNDFRHHFGLASLYDNMDKEAEAVKEYRRSLEVHPLKNSIAATRIFEITGKHVPPTLENLKTDQIPFESKAKVMFIEASVNGVQGRFLLDTGASFSVIFKSKAAQFDIHPQKITLPMEAANGAIIQAPVAYGNLRIGRYDIQNSCFTVIPDLHDPNVDGIIGMNVMEGFQFEIDQSSHLITLKR